MSESQFSKPSVNSISQSFEKSQEKSFHRKNTDTKNKAQAMLAPIGVQSSERSRLLELSKGSIAQAAADVNTKNSLKLTDSEGNELSAEQQKFFKNSKVRDEDGNLLVVYHGTDADFTVFDRTKGRSAMDIQGSFFSPWELDAQGYGSEVKPYYLNITNPASEGVAYKALNRFKGQNYAGVKAREYLESLGYDGVNNGNEEYIAFYPSQIKSIDNFSPTQNPDIRYSLKNINQNEVDKEKKKGNNKKRNYNEADTLFMQWSNSPSIPVGELKMFKRGNDWVWFEKSEDGCVEMYRGKYKKEVLNYGKTDTETDTSYDEDIKEIGLNNGRDLRNLLGIGNKGNADRYGRQTESQRFQPDTEGNNEYLRTGNIGISDVTDTDTKSSLRHSLGIIDENPANQSLIAQNEAFRRIISEQQHVLNRHFVDSKKVRTNNCNYHKKRTAETPSILFEIILYWLPLPCDSLFNTLNHRIDSSFCVIFFSVCEAASEEAPERSLFSSDISCRRNKCRSV